MTVDSLMKEHKMTIYKLSKESGVPYTTVNDICSGKARIEKCSAETIYRLSKVFKVTMEQLLENAMEGDGRMRSSFEIYKSNICHRVKDIGDIDFIIHTLESNEIRKLYERRWYPECLYLLAMVDYLSRENDIPLCTNYNDLRAQRLKDTIFPASILAASSAMSNEKIKQDSYETAIPEFKRFNIIENEVRNVY